jgi:phosphatidate cytidylyltransferase
MLPLLLFVWWGGFPFYIACLALTTVALWEFAGVFGRAPAEVESEFARMPKPSFIIPLFGALSLYAIVVFMDDWMFIFFWLFLVTVLSLLMMFKRSTGLSDAALTITANVYIVFFLAHAVIVELYFTFSENESMWAPIGFGNPIWLILLTAFGSDMFAYFTGALFGKHKLCPNLSPKKTIEGLVGGIVGSTLLCGVFGYFFLGYYFSGSLLIPLPGGNSVSAHLLIIGALGGAAAALGDLAASAIKRKLGVKDYGQLIPGHGGVLDRIDSVLFTAPFVYYYLLIMDYIIMLTSPDMFGEVW